MSPRSSCTGRWWCPTCPPSTSRRASAGCRPTAARWAPAAAPGIGSLSAYCGATSAGCGAGAGVCYLYGGKYKEISHTIVNALAINSGMLCDGAKASCAAKIASAVEAGLLGMQMYLHNSQFYGGDGIVAKGVENTIRTVSTIAREGMRATDGEIIRFMIGNASFAKDGEG